MKIYTKTGDKGTTSLLSGERVPKYHERIEAYGTIDELNSFVGLLRSADIKKEDNEFLIKIQHHLFNIGSLLALGDKEVKFKMPEITENEILEIEQAMDKMDNNLPKLKSFVLPGGEQTVAYCHVCRSICRRAERLIIKLNTENKINKHLLQYINRLSDYFFMLSRKIAHEKDFEEIKWEM
ncbi:MAG: cob(I)yrinic acid a,c-diamide adenosyltransferase [Bacteroidales bacterium]|nr:cob(I)yrinic acid a,c-diamide adenosyltransferase [Bacteroidales bacterium]